MTGKKTKALIAALLVVLCLETATRADDIAFDRAGLERSALERLLGNHKVVNVVDDFLAFREQAGDKPLRTQRRMWMRMVQSKHRDYFDRAVYRGAEPAQRRAMLNEFLIRVPERVEAIRELNRTITDNLIVAFIHFKDFRFREYQQQHDVYFGLSFFRFDGAVRPVQNDQGIPDTLLPRRRRARAVLTRATPCDAYPRVLPPVSFRVPVPAVRRLVRGAPDAAYSAADRRPGWLPELSKLLEVSRN